MVSCSSNEDPTPKYSELVGTWKIVSGSPIILTIDSEGNLNLNCGNNKYRNTHCNYTGKLTDNFDYPYTIELTFTISSHASITSCAWIKDDWFIKQAEGLEQYKTGKFTFTDASTLTVSAWMLSTANNSVEWINLYNGNIIFKKQ